jgi:hypothetical protein
MDHKITEDPSSRPFQFLLNNIQIHFPTGVHTGYYTIFSIASIPSPIYSEKSLRSPPYALILVTHIRS